ncbi:hypothetical protein J6590_056093 [Homalodisca vitripennis]|nr:hypothetical protein J6590_056093 [Homalodisca vitripennis]
MFYSVERKAKCFPTLTAVTSRHGRLGISRPPPLETFDCQPSPLSPDYDETNHWQTAHRSSSSIKTKIRDSAVVSNDDGSAVGGSEESGNYTRLETL